MSKTPRMHDLDNLDVSSILPGGIITYDEATTNFVASTGFGDDVKRFGAVGDGTTDDYQAFFDANAAGEFIVPPGKYLIGSDITLTERMYLMPGARVLAGSGVTVTGNALVSGPGVFGGEGTVNLARIEVTVGGTSPDFTTVQAAVDDCPRFLHNYYVVFLRDGTYAEDLLIEGIHAMQMNEPAVTGETARIRIEGEADIAQDPNVLLKSFLFVGCTGQGHALKDMTVYDRTPYVNESVRGGAFGCPSDIQLDSLSFAGNAADYGIISYASNIRTGETDFGSDLLKSAMVIKGGGFLKSNPGNSGDVGDAIIEVSNGSAVINDMSEITYGGDRPVKITEGTVRCNVSGEMYGVGHNELPALNYYSVFESIDGYTTAFTGSGTMPNSGTDGVVLSTGTTSGSTANIYKVYRRTLATRGFEEFRTFGACLNSADFGNDCEFYAVTGNLGGKYIGFKTDTGTLYGVCHDGTTETTTNLGATSVNLRLVCKFWPGSRIEFFNNEIHVGDITTGLPSGNPSGTDSYCDFRIENTAAVDSDIRICEWMIYKRGVSAFS